MPFASLKRSITGVSAKLLLVIGIFGSVWDFAS